MGWIDVTSLPLSLSPSLPLPSSYLGYSTKSSLSDMLTISWMLCIASKKAVAADQHSVVAACHSYSSLQGSQYASDIISTATQHTHTIGQHTRHTDTEERKTQKASRQDRGDAKSIKDKTAKTETCAVTLNHCKPAPPPRSTTDHHLTQSSQAQLILVT